MKMNKATIRTTKTISNCFDCPFIVYGINEKPYAYVCIKTRQEVKVNGIPNECPYLSKKCKHEWKPLGYPDHYEKCEKCGKVR